MSGDRHTLRQRREQRRDHGNDLLRLSLQFGRARLEQSPLLEPDHQSVFGQFRTHLILEVMFLDILIELFLYLREVFIFLQIGAVAVIGAAHQRRVLRRRRPHAREERRPAHIERRRKGLRKRLHLRRVGLGHGEQRDKEREQQRHQIGIRQQPSLTHFLLMGFRMLFLCHISPLPSAPHAPSGG